MGEDKTVTIVEPHDLGAIPVSQPSSGAFGAYFGSGDSFIVVGASIKAPGKLLGCNYNADSNAIGTWHDLTNRSTTICGHSGGSRTGSRAGYLVCAGYAGGLALVSSYLV